jgi:hypothetical protein
MGDDAPQPSAGVTREKLRNQYVAYCHTICHNIWNIVAYCVARFLQAALSRAALKVLLGTTVCMICASSMILFLGPIVAEKVRIEFDDAVSTAWFHGPALKSSILLMFLVVSGFVLGAGLVAMC